MDLPHRRHLLLTTIVKNSNEMTRKLRKRGIVKRMEQ